MKYKSVAILMTCMMTVSLASCSSQSTGTSTGDSSVSTEAAGGAEGMPDESFGGGPGGPGDQSGERPEGVPGDESGFPGGEGGPGGERPEGDAVWNVTGTSAITSLTIGDDAKVVIPDGVTLTVDGKEYTGKTLKAGDI